MDRIYIDLRYMFSLVSGQRIFDVKINTCVDKTNHAITQLR